MILEALGIKKRFNREVLAGIDLQIKAGSITALLGVSGSGKSTLLKILGLLLKYDSGQIKILGDDINKLNDKRLADLRGKHIGFLFQFHYLMKGFTVLENITMPAMINKINRVEAANKAKQLLSMLDLSNLANRSVETLSGGESQKVSLLRAMIMSPELILADEPTGNLDSISCNQLLSIIEWSRERGTSFLIATHDKKVASIADDILTLKDGRLM